MQRRIHGCCSVAKLHAHHKHGRHSAAAIPVVHDTPTQWHNRQRKTKRHIYIYIYDANERGHSLRAYYVTQTQTHGTCTCILEVRFSVSVDALFAHICMRARICICKCVCVFALNGVFVCKNINCRVDVTANNSNYCRNQGELIPKQITESHINICGVPKANCI